MIPQPYTQLSDLALLELCCWREARGQPMQGITAVANVVKNRTKTPAWYNGNVAGSYKAVILAPSQFSSQVRPMFVSFNPNDPQHDLWPSDTDPSFVLCTQAAISVYTGRVLDNTAGAINYFDTSITWPSAWGNESDWVNTLNVGRLRFWRPRSIPAPPAGVSAVDTVTVS
jgi:spore germination cell wall hydrolase CwlJ-like protein